MALTVARDPHFAAAHSIEWPKIVFWTLAFLFAWNWRAIGPLFGEGALPDTDDFTRLQQVRDWMAGQGWFDLIQHRFDPPTGADIHWSRLADVPIAALIGLFGLFLDSQMAERAALLVWPALLLVATVIVVVRICAALIDRFNPLLAVLFTVTCLTAMTEYLPGRIDHHGLQILLFCLILLGLATPAARWSGFLIGAAIAASVSVGLDAILLIVLVLAWLGLDWAIGRDRDGRLLLRVGAGMFLAAPLLFAANLSPAEWSVAHCDANSIVYLTALAAISIGFAWLGMASPALLRPGRVATGAVRLTAGVIAGGTVVSLLYWLYPQCAAGPYGEIAPSLYERWLVNINEAMPIGERLEKYPELWFSGVAFSLFLLLAGTLVVWKHGRERPGLIALYAALLLSVGAAIIQYRALRIGIFAAIPLCVLFAGMAAEWFEARLRRSAPLRGLANAAVIVLLLPPVWWIGGTAIAGAGSDVALAGKATAGGEDDFAEWRKDDDAPLCNRQEQYSELAKLPAGMVMSDINSGPPILVFTGHWAIGGPYHRNGAAILDMLDFFETDLEKPRDIAARRGIDYVYFCDTGDFTRAEAEASASLAGRIVLGTEPGWLERLTPKGQRYHLFRVR
jgi:hypothetical protein